MTFQTIGEILTKISHYEHSLLYRKEEDSYSKDSIWQEEKCNAIWAGF